MHAPARGLLTRLRSGRHAAAPAGADARSALLARVGAAGSPPRAPGLPPPRPRSAGDSALAHPAGVRARAPGGAAWRPLGPPPSRTNPDRGSSAAAAAHQSVRGPPPRAAAGPVLPAAPAEWRRSASLRDVRGLARTDDVRAARGPCSTGARVSGQPRAGRAGTCGSVRRRSHRAAWLAHPKGARRVPRRTTQIIVATIDSAGQPAAARPAAETGAPGSAAPSGFSAAARSPKPRRRCGRRRTRWCPPRSPRPSRGRARTA